MILSPVIFKPGSVDAQENVQGERFKIVEKTFIQFTWRLVSRDGRGICTVKIDHEGFPTNNETLAACVIDLEKLGPAVTPFPEGTPQPTSTPINLNQVFLETYWVFESSQEVTTTTKVKIPDMIVNIYAPGLPVSAPYIVIKAIEPYSEFHISRIAGTINNDPFECLSDQCIVPLIQDARIKFWAESSFGDQSQTITATARSYISNNFYNVRITTIDRKIEFTDSCRQIWSGTAYGESPDWVVFPESPEMLNTQHNLHYLAGKLILNKFVDASSCPQGGLNTDGSPNACGLELSKNAMIAWQNRFDSTIWAAGKEYGISPILIKSIIEQESQFWPENARYLYEEFGFSQINELGADAALRWDEDLKNQICSSLLFDCDPSFAKMNAFEQAMLRGGLIRSINAYCPTCENMIDLDIAEQSISISTQVLRSNCSQTNYIVDNLGLKQNITDMWKFTILSYHSGYDCLEKSLKNTIALGKEPNWENVSNNLACFSGKSYVDSMWDKLTSFQFYIAPQPTLSPLQLTPTGQANLAELEATPTPIASPTAKTYLSSGKIHVYLYIDENMNYAMDVEELINKANVEVTFANGVIKTVPIVNGEAIIEYEDQFKNSNIKITIKETYQTIELKIPDSGQLFTIVRIPPPTLPNTLP
ncbi:MAG: hypothetical protein CVU46_06100 [Chloroflexi bacterium HGW-Chloroflexi-8]|nr:MAG: hypothetical protein CVU46_06100 [Chloroflexi bacterium HGW-Chloroflexi-8]